ncbi:hypothetical protein N7457_008976 [Penicillium paradoxum]|uniref:uncharacterized protein n=1 Tax=Penicillium paradoxum TaxID=176176 RepID=UPI002547DCDE|nr:uncharacterized protein N7457_008976 [Penicillium paradoxum]KAJ5774080.1 hypothetical protein N7457_008976 [Penicillium paradoxum]
MGSAASKPAKSAAGAAARRQYPKQTVPPPRGPRKAAKEAKTSPTPAPTSAPTPQANPSPHPKPHQARAPPPQGPTYHSKEKASSVKSDAIDMDGRDPDFAASLRSIGPVNPSPTFSNSSTVNRAGPMQTVFPQASNPALLTVTSRQRLTEAADKEAEDFGRAGHPGRSFLDALTIQQVLTMRDKQGMRRGDIERFLGLKKGVLERLGKDEIVSRIT